MAREDSVQLMGRSILPENVGLAAQAHRSRSPRTIRVLVCVAAVGPCIIAAVQIICAHHTGLETFHEGLKVWYTGCYNSEALNDLGTDRCLPKTKDLVFRSRRLIDAEDLAYCSCDNTGLSSEDGEPRVRFLTKCGFRRQRRW